MESLSVKRLSKITGLPQYELKLILRNLNSVGWISYANQEYTVTRAGSLEVTSKVKGLKIIAISPDFYYPYKV
ncbi:hypothetical protein P9393_24550, partial [Escherichia coli]